MSRRKRFTMPKRSNSFALNITSMTDMFTIMLVFLLQSFASTTVPLEPIQGMRLPSSNTTLNPVEGVKISITQEELRVGDHLLAGLNASQFKQTDVDSKDPNFIPSLFQELDTLAKSGNAEYLKEGRVLLQADARLPYETLRKVLYTASMAGFPQLKMVAMAGN